MSKHIHHIKPKHAGGDNSPNNLIELTIEEHAEAHRILWEKNNQWQDYVSWKALSGQIGKEEIRKLLSRLTWLGRKHTNESKEKIKEARAKQIFSKETKEKMSNTRKNRKRNWNVITPESNLKRSASMSGIKKKTVKCPNCEKIGGYPQMKQWHFENCKRLKCV